MATETTATRITCPPCNVSAYERADLDCRDPDSHAPHYTEHTGDGWANDRAACVEYRLRATGLAPNEETYRVHCDPVLGGCGWASARHPSREDAERYRDHHLEHHDAHNA